MSAAVRKGKKARREADDAARAIPFVKSQRGQALTTEERLDILALQANLRVDNEVVPRKEHVANKIGRLLGRSNKTCGEVWSTFLSHGAVLPAATPANRRAHATRLPDTQIMKAEVRDFIRGRCETRTRTTAKDVMHLLAKKGYIEVDRSSPGSIKAALRAVQRFVKKHGYTRGAHKGKSLRLSPSNDLTRAQYVQKMTSSAILSHQIVYMDESYIHHHYTRHNDSLVDPTDDSYVKAKHKGRRLCFIAAILDRDRSVPDEESDEAAAAELLLDTVDIFEGGKQTANYHGMFCHDYFVNWMDTLIQALEHRGLQHCIIVMDNAKYHKVLPASTPKKGNRREIMISAMKEYGLEIPAGATKAIMWEILSKHIQDNVVPVIIDKARASSHEVVLTPPYHSDLQPIELVWANVKGEVGRQYSTTTKFSDIKPRLERAFANVSPKSVQGCIGAANKQLMKLKEHLAAMDACEELSSEAIDSDSEENSSSLST